MLKKEVKTAKNAVRLLELCLEKGLSQKQILMLVRPIGEAQTIQEKGNIALALTRNLLNTDFIC